jgi:hypothetical protein
MLLSLNFITILNLFNKIFKRIWIIHIKCQPLEEIYLNSTPPYLNQIYIILPLA